MWRALTVLMALGAAAAQAAEVSFPAVAYHDIVERRDADAYSVTRAEFLEQLRYLKSEGYTPVSLRQIDAARRGVGKLPGKPVLLTFDDGLKSFATRALPLLKEFGYPAVLAVVTAWVDGRSAPDDYSGELLSWDDLRRIRDVGDVEIVSHSDDLHYGVPSNPQGNKAPAGRARIYRASGGYETEEAFRDRIRADLTMSVQRLREELKIAPMAIVWPYGQYDGVTMKEAQRLGMTYQLTLDEAPNALDTLPRIGRSTFLHYRRLADFDAMLTTRAYRLRQLRFVDIGLETVASLSDAERSRWLSTLLARLQLLQVNAVIVRPVSTSGAALFPTSAMPVAADALNRVLHQIGARAHVNHIYLWFPEKIPDGAYRDVARLNRFAGAIVDETDVRRFREIATLLRAYQPAIRVGAPGAHADADFRFVELDTDMKGKGIEAQAGAALAKTDRVMFLLHRPAGLADDKLIEAMRALRDSGARHYGYDNDDAAGNAPALRRVVPELRAFTIGSGAVP